MSHSFKHNLQIPLLTARCTTPLHPLYSEILKASCSTFKWFREMPENMPYFCNMKTQIHISFIKSNQKLFASTFNSSCPRNMEQFGNGGKNARTFLKFQSLF